MQDCFQFHCSPIQCIWTVFSDCLFNGVSFYFFYNSLSQSLFLFAFSCFSFNFPYLIPFSSWFVFFSTFSFAISAMFQPYLHLEICYSVCLMFGLFVTRHMLLQQFFEPHSKYLSQSSKSFTISNKRRVFLPCQCAMCVHFVSIFRTHIPFYGYHYSLELLSSCH